MSLLLRNHELLRVSHQQIQKTNPRSIKTLRHAMATIVVEELVWQVKGVQCVFECNVHRIEI